MKTKFFTILAAAGLFFLASCGGGVSEDTKKAVKALDSSVTAMMGSVDALAGEVTKALEMCNASCAAADSCAASCKPEMKGKCDSAMADCKGAKADFESIMNTINTAKGEWAADTTWAAFMGKVEKGGIKDEEAKKELATFTTWATDAGTKLTEWTTAFNTANERCKAGDAAWAAYVASVPAPKGKK